ncbi:hypothetical protein QAD02_010851 [Eretmocerus hayati]|uniref:Uncharacterized protein n=1 Tax=Eretmocerus hayati TaxID=131215 RepID=A0ACC2NV34_9HYME|nr:hypothetical protein QAD02_010851 [Eretmocerus hayati]
MRLLDLYLLLCLVIVCRASALNSTGTIDDVNVIGSPAVVTQIATGDKNYDELEIPPLEQTHNPSWKRVKRQNRGINLNVPPVQQQSPNYCVVACCESLLRHLGLTSEQARPPVGLPATASYQDSLGYRFFSREGVGPDLFLDFDLATGRFRDRQYGTTLFFVERLNALIMGNGVNAGGEYRSRGFGPLRYANRTTTEDVYFTMQRLIDESLRNNMPVILARTQRVRNYVGDVVYPERWSGHATLIHSIGPTEIHPMRRHYGIMDPWTGTFRDVTGWDIGSEGEFWLVYYDAGSRPSQHILPTPEPMDIEHTPEPMEVEELDYNGLGVRDDLRNPNGRSLCWMGAVGQFSGRRKRDINSNVPRCSGTTNAFIITVIKEYNEQPPQDGWLQEGALFIGTNHGVYLINGDQVNERRPEIRKFKLNIGIRDIIIDHRGSAFVIDSKGDMYHLNTITLDYVKYNLQGAKVHVVKVLERDDGVNVRGTVYIGTDRGVYLKFGDELDKQYINKFKLSENIRDILWDNRGSAFAISFSGNIYRLYMKGWSFVQYDLGGAKVNVVKVLNDDDGVLTRGSTYIGTNKGVYFKHGDDLNRKPADKFNIIANIREFVWDNRGSAFAISNEGRMFHLNMVERTFSEYNLNGGKVNVVKVLASRDGNFDRGTAYIGTSKGVSFKYGDALDGSEVDRFNLNADVVDIILDNEGSAFAVTSKGDKYHLNKRGWGIQRDGTNVPMDTRGGLPAVITQGEKATVIKILYEDYGERLINCTAYIGTDKGVRFKYEGELGTEHTDVFKINDAVRNIVLDTRGSAFVITQKRDLFHLNVTGFGFSKYDLDGAEVTVPKVATKTKGKLIKGTYCLHWYNQGYPHKVCS